MWNGGVEAHGRAGIGEGKRVGWGRGGTLTKPPPPFGEALSSALHTPCLARPETIHPTGNTEVSAGAPSSWAPLFPSVG